eukprot:m.160744 g.160744  ORF g.160744 m.160744 type:complete len:699 (+) comp17056_c2_seq5:91-2187(+)
MAGDDGFVVALATNVAIMAIVMVLFNFLWRRFPKVYTPRLLLEKENPPPTPAPGIFGWIRTALKVDDQTFLEQVGMDGFMWTVFFRCMFQAFCICSLFAMIVLIPVNSNGGEDLTGLDSISLSNVTRASSRLWAHLISCYFFTGVIFFYLRKTYMVYIHERAKHVMQGLHQHHTVLVRDLGPAFNTPQKVYDAFAKMYPDVVSVHMVQELTDLEGKIKRRDQALYKLEHFQAIVTKYPHKARPLTRVGGYVCCGGEKVDAETYFFDLLTRRNAKVKEEIKQVTELPKYGPSALVTFASIMSASTAAQVNHTCCAVPWTVTPAPHIEDIVWENLWMSQSTREVRHSLFKAATWALIVFYVIPVAFVATLTTLQSLSDKVPFLADVVDVSPILKGFLEGFLPTLALLVFMMLLPAIMCYFAKHEGRPDKVSINLAAVSKMYNFQIINVFFVSIIAGSVFDAISNIIDSPTSIITLLGESIPRTGIFFTNYVMLQAISSVPMSVLKFFKLIIVKLKLKYLARSERERLAVWEPESPNYVEDLPGQMLVVMLGMVYATVAPIILPFVILFFGFSYIIYRFSFLYMLKPEFETGGLFWPLIFDRIMLGVMVYEFTMLGVFGIFKGAAQAPLMVPLIVISFLFWQHMNKYRGIGVHPPRLQVSELEAGKSKEELDPEAYKMPPLAVELEPSFQTFSEEFRVSAV